MTDETYNSAFALAYRTLWEERFAVPVSRFFPRISEHFNIQGRTFADIACGTGRFALELAKQGYKGIGLDLSPAMIAIAHERIAKETLALTFEVQDMRGFQFRSPVDFITCWYDSLNYLGSLEEVKTFFESCYRALELRGCLLFDIETCVAFQYRWGKHQSLSSLLSEIGVPLLRGHLHGAFYRLRDRWRSRDGRSVRTFVGKDAIVEAISQFDTINNRVTTHFNGRVEYDGERLPISEVHVQQAFTIESLKEYLHEVGFSPVFHFRLPDFMHPATEERRVYFCAFKDR
jgi:SAM-dependent methyltransferase